MSEKLIFEGVVEFEAEDSGAALIASLRGGDDEENGSFVRIQSWDSRIWSSADTDGSTQEIADRALRGELGDIHADAQKLSGKNVRVTIEVLND